MTGVDCKTKECREDVPEMDLKTKEKDIKCINKQTIGTDLSYTHEIVWTNVFGFLVMHICAVYGLYLVFLGSFSTSTYLWTFFLSLLLNQGVTSGAHRYYTHKTFKAKPILQVIFILCHTLAGQNALFTWARDHRLHHRYSDTDGDPHNAKRGFFFCHMGWVMVKKNPMVIELGRKIDMTDLLADPIVMWQKKYYLPLYFIVAFFIPVAVPVYFFGETWTNSIMFCYFTRYLYSLHATWLVNSAAHIYGTRPYDKSLQPVESWIVSFLTLGEGWHNYHHTFPWDYRAAESTMPFNGAAAVIRFCEKIGWAYDLKTADPEMVEKRIIRKGDGTHYQLGNDADKAAVTAIGPLHPFNPTYTTKMKHPDAILPAEGLPLFHEKDLLNTESKERETRSG